MAIGIIAGALGMAVTGVIIAGGKITMNGGITAGTLIPHRHNRITITAIIMTTVGMTIAVLVTIIATIIVHRQIIVNPQKKPGIAGLFRLLFVTLKDQLVVG